MSDLLSDKRYWAYYAFTATVVAAMLLAEDALEGGETYSELLFDFITDIPVFTLIISLISLPSWHTINLLNRHYPWEEAFRKRFILEMCLIVTIVVTMTVVASYLVRTLGWIPPDADNDFGFEISVLIILSVLVFMTFGFHEFMVLSTDKQFLELKASRLEKQNYLIKYEALKSQINPHFLFNSLNALSSLIYQDTAKSDQFIKKFSDVFRYVLELNQEQLVQVKRELTFLESYFFLQKIRYGTGLGIEKKISAEALNSYIPPLTLQLVVENAIKHNVISDERALSIIIESRDGYLVVSNNYQHRTTLSESTGIGQQNLIEKYQLIEERLPEFYVENDRYVVRLPLMKELSWNEC